MFLFYIRNQRRTNEYECYKNLFPKSYDLPAMHRVGKVSFGKFMLEKFRIIAASKFKKLIHSCKNVFVYCKSSRVEFLVGRKLRSTASKNHKILCFFGFL